MDRETKPARKPYEKPTVHVIDLAADEVLGTGCKSTGGGGPSGFLGNCVVDKCWASAGS